MQIGTFHAICLEFLKAQGEEPVLMTEEEQRRLSEETIVESGISISAKRFLEAVSRCKSGTAAEEAMPAEEKIPEEEWKKGHGIFTRKRKKRGICGTLMTFCCGRYSGSKMAGQQKDGKRNSAICS